MSYIVANTELAQEACRRLASQLPPDDAQLLREALDDVGFGANRVREIVRDLRSFSRSESETLVPVDLLRPLSASLSLTSRSVVSRATVRQELKPVSPVLASEGRLCQVFVNLLVNAAQAIPEGRAADNFILVKTGMNGSGLAVVEIIDTGVGIPSANLERVLDPFFTTKASGEGTGLGLAICYRIVQEPRGRLCIESEVGKGTTVRVELPIVEAIGANAGEANSPAAL